MNILAIIPMRSGSKGVKDKNVISFHGKPLFAWSVDQARAAQLDVFISTDSPKYMDIINSRYPKENFCPVRRPDKLAKDDTPTSKVILHVLDYLEEQGKSYDIFVLLEPTSPLRFVRDITEPLAMLRDNKKYRAVVSMCEQPSYNPILAYEIKRTRDGDHPIPFGGGQTYSGHPRRQAYQKAYFMDGTIYASYVDTYRDKKSFVHDLTMVYYTQPWQATEIDREDDLISVGAFMERVK